MPYWYLSHDPFHVLREKTRFPGYIRLYRFKIVTDRCADRQTACYTYAWHAYMTTIINKHQLSLTNLRDALHHGKHAVNKGGRSV